MKTRIIKAILVYILLIACGQTATTSEPDMVESAIHATENPPTGLPEPSSSPTAPQAATSTTEPVATLTTEPAATLPPLQGEPDATLSETGPWLVFQLESGLWAIDADGAGMLELVSTGERNNLDFLYNLTAAPRGSMAAFVQIEERYSYSPSPPLLNLLSLPDGQIRQLAMLLPEGINYDYDVPGNDVEDALQRWGSVGTRNQISWSSDGGQLAFAGAMDGPSSDLYVYSIGNDEITRLTSGPTHAVVMGWSPDDRYILNGGVTHLGVNTSGSGFDWANIWAARADDSGVNLIFETDMYGFENVLDWTSSTTYLGDEFVSWEGYYGLKLVDIASGVVQPLDWCGDYSNRAFDPQSGMILLAVTEEQLHECNPDPEPGVYLLSLDGGPAERVYEFQAEYWNEVAWSPDLGVFLLLTEEGVLTIDTSGNLGLLPSPAEYIYFDRYEANLPVFALDGQRWAFNVEGVWIGEPDTELRQIYEDEVDELTWSPDGQTLFFFNDDGVYLAFAPDFMPQLAAANMSPFVRFITPVWVER
ncbi:MAG: hypothetical protein FVQ83_03160 [Chloroflexi bacterium]|nr:hypothetical protein [Chloroflexota bacterium]